MKDINGGSTSGSSLASAQQIVKDLNKAFSGTKISFWLKGYNNLSLNYSTFSNNDKNELVKLFNQDSHSDCIDMYMLSRTPDKDIKDGTETVGGTIATSYPTSLSIKHNNRFPDCHIGTCPSLCMALGRFFCWLVLWYRMGGKE
ncbi:MAG: hypothetical protein HDS15_05915 [Bacteroides sp.]|nr:hypothetical protein [Bacteroides sp.]